jgi:hypothetical protein
MNFHDFHLPRAVGFLRFVQADWVEGSGNEFSLPGALYRTRLPAPLPLVWEFYNHEGI